jgi:large subunit ribosomal protein L6
MSRIGKKPVPLPSGVKCNVSGRTVVVESSKGKLSMTHRPEVTVKVEGGQVVVERNHESRVARAMHGMTRAIINNMVVGVSAGFKKVLEVNGVGWTIQVQGKKVKLNVGYADTRELTIPMGVDVQVAGSKVTVSGADRQAVGQLAADIRRQRPPEPYNGKGIKYSDEQIVRKQGKQFAGGGAA